jgi:hypothetical protein
MIFLNFPRMSELPRFSATPEKEASPTMEQMIELLKADEHFDSRVEGLYRKWKKHDELHTRVCSLNPFGPDGSTSGIDFLEQDYFAAASGTPVTVPVDSPVNRYRINTYSTLERMGLLTIRGGAVEFTELAKELLKYRALKRLIVNMYDQTTARRSLVAKLTPQEEALLMEDLG